MGLETTQAMLAAAQKGHYAVGAFNAENMEMIQAIVQAAQELHAPVIIQTTPGTLRYAAADSYYANAAAVAARVCVPVAVHLDHGESETQVVQALRAGYTSVMIDGSRMDLAGNIALSKRVVDACAPCGVTVEGELGRVGGKEDDLEDAGSGYTDLEEAVRFVRETGVDSLAVGVGTAHGVYEGVPHLNIPRIAELRERLEIPLVLHGASGLSDDTVRACIAQGICKVNFATELRVAYTTAVRTYLLVHPNAIDPKSYGACARTAVTVLVKQRMQVCGCVGKAGNAS